jgi:predicted Zn-dependent peptidase
MKQRCSYLYYFIAITFYFILANTTVYADVIKSRKALNRLTESVQSYELPNGIKVIFYPRPNEVPIFAGAVAVRVGSVDEPKGLTGISHLLEHMAFKGTKDIGTKNFEEEEPLLKQQEELYTLQTKRKLNSKESELLKQTELKLQALWNSDEFTKLLTEKGVSGFNATTDQEFTKYFESLPVTAFEFWCWIESERLLNPVFRQFYQERDVVLEERRMRFEDNPEGRLYEQFLQVAFLSHPYRHPVIGYEQDIKRITPSDLRAFHNKYYIGTNIAIGISGNIDPIEKVKLVQKYFGRIPRGNEIVRVKESESTQESERFITLPLKAAPSMFIGYHKPVFPHPDDAAITVLGEMLSGGSSSPLYKSLVKDKNIVSSISYGEGPGFGFPNLFYFFINPRVPNKSEQVKVAFDTEIDRFLSSEFSTKRMEIAKRGIAMEYLLDLQSNVSLAKNFATSQLLYGDWAAFLKWYDSMAKVSIEDIIRVANQYLVPGNRTVAMITDQK